jgi:hypothetical protein
VVDDINETNWFSPESKEVLNSKVLELSETLKMDEPNYDDFENNADGTDVIDGHLIEIIYPLLSKNFDSEQDQLYYDFRLGCIIKHQLTYTEFLSAKIEMV